MQLFRKPQTSLFLLTFWLLFFCPVYAAQKPIVYFGIIPRYNPMIMYQNYQPIMDYLSENTPYRFELKLAHDYAQTVEHLRTGVTQVASLGDVTFVAANQSFGAKPILRPRNSLGKPDYASLIIVRKESPITSIAELKGKSFAFGNIHSTSGNLIPRYFLFQQGVALTELSRFENLSTHTDVARAVLKGKFAAGALKDVVAYRYQKSGLRILANSDPIPAVPIVVHPDTPQEVIEALKAALLVIDPENPKYSTLLSHWDPEFRNGFVPADITDYQPIFQMLHNIPEGCGKTCHPR